MNLTNDAIAAWAVALISPALVFVAALHVRPLLRARDRPQECEGVT